MPTVYVSHPALLGRLLWSYYKSLSGPGASAPYSAFSVRVTFVSGMAVNVSASAWDAMSNDGIASLTAP